jgi:hypothetical protein
VFGHVGFLFASYVARDHQGAKKMIKSTATMTQEIAQAAIAFENRRRHGQVANSREDADGQGVKRAGNGPA